MAAEKAEKESVHTVTIEVSPEGDVIAGGAMTLRGAVSCSQGCDLEGRTLKIMDQDTVVTNRELVVFDGKASETAAFEVNTPAEPGTYTWSAVFPKQEADGAIHELTSAPLSFTVEPHPTDVNVWDVPSAIVAGGRFSIKVGIKCAFGCELTDGTFEVYDHEGTLVSTGTIGNDPWPGTTALFFGEVEFTAPDDEGIQSWEVRTRDWGNEMKHSGGTRAFRVNIVPSPDYVVTVEAIDKDKQTPIAGMHVVLHPFRAVTDERGVARLSVPKGEYNLHVSGLRYFPFSANVEATEDRLIKAELEWETRPEKIS